MVSLPVEIALDPAGHVLVGGLGGDLVLGGEGARLPGEVVLVLHQVGDDGAAVGAEDHRVVRDRLLLFFKRLGHRLFRREGRVLELLAELVEALAGLRVVEHRLEQLVGHAVQALAIQVGGIEGDGEPGQRPAQIVGEDLVLVDAVGRGGELGVEVDELGVGLFDVFLERLGASRGRLGAVVRRRGAAGGEADAQADRHAGEGGEAGVAASLLALVVDLFANLDLDGLLGGAGLGLGAGRLALLRREPRRERDARREAGGRRDAGRERRRRPHAGHAGDGAGPGRRRRRGSESTAGLGARRRRHGTGPRRWRGRDGRRRGHAHRRRPAESRLQIDLGFLRFIVSHRLLGGSAR